MADQFQNEAKSKKKRTAKASSRKLQMSQLKAAVRQLSPAKLRAFREWILKFHKSNVSTNKRPYGLAAGEFEIRDDFDAPLPDDILREFEQE